MARRALGPASLAAVQAVRASFPDDAASVLVACSGGADSLALAFAVGHVAVGRAVPYTAAVVDHGLQPGSADVAAAAADQLRSLGYLDVEVCTVVVPPGGGGPEAAAREVRYASLEAAGATRGAVLALGHTLDDQAESVLLGLARGSGTRSLAGMPVRSGARWRPLLGLRRALTEQVCAEQGLVAWADPHNADPAYARVRVRDRVLPVLESELGPGVAAALARTAALARADADLLDALAAAADPGTETLGCAALVALPAALRTRVLRRWLLARGARDLASAHVEAVDALLTRWRGQGPVALPGLSIARRDGALHAL